MNKMKLYDDEGKEIKLNLVPIPSLCITCKKHTENREEVLCNLVRCGNIKPEEFYCFSYEGLKEKEEKNRELMRKIISSKSQREYDHSVIIQFEYPEDDLNPLFDLEDKLDKIITENNAGDFDGNEMQIGGSDARLYMYGYNAEILFKLIQPELRKVEFMKGAVAFLSFGNRLDSPRIEVEV